MSAIDDYLQLVAKGTPLNNQWQQLKHNVNQNIPQASDVHDPAKMQEWAINAALNAPMMGTIRPAKLREVLDQLEARGFDTKTPWYHGGPNLVGQGQWNKPSFFAKEREGADWFAKEMAVRHNEQGNGVLSDYPGGVVNKVFLRGKPLDMRKDYMEGLTATGESNPELIKHIENAGIKVEPTDYGSVEIPEVAQHSNKAGSNINDAMYIPAFQRYLEERGLNSLRNYDHLFRDEIDARIMINPADIFNVATKKPTQAQWLAHKIKPWK